MEQLTHSPALRYYATETTVQTEFLTETILSEYTLTLYLNGTLYQNFHCIPEALEELILGHLYTSGMIGSMEDVISYSIDRTMGTAYFDIKKQDRKMKRLSDIAIHPEEILPLSNKLLTTSKVFEKTGNVHSVMLCRGGTVLYFSEDVDRYHAFEKTVGKAFKDGVSFDTTSIYTTGRIPSQIATKAIFAGIPMIVSRSAPTDLTIALAKDYHLTVIGFARGERMNVYYPLPPQAFNNEKLV